LAPVPQKSRTPRPPKVQAPKTRPHGPKAKAGAPAPSDRNTRYLLFALAGAGVIALAIVAVVLATAGGGSSRPSRAEVAAAMKAAGFSFKTVKGDTAGHHVTSLKAKIKYDTFPPSSGTHYYQPAVWDFYTDDAVNPIQAVHNLEHGGIVMWWGPKVPESTIEQMRSFYNESPNAMLGTQLKGLGDRIALSAWVQDKTGIHGEVAIGHRFDEKAFKAFRDAFRGEGPEKIPVDFNKPGT
jgi:hypothetical protein